MQRSFVLGFIGPSGSGKTTLVRALQERLASRGEYWEIQTLSARYTPFLLPWEVVLHMDPASRLQRQKDLGLWLVQRMVELEADWLYRPRRILLDRVGAWETWLYTKYLFPDWEEDFFYLWKAWTTDWIHRNLAGLVLVEPIDHSEDDPYRPGRDPKFDELYYAWTNELSLPILDLPPGSLEERVERTSAFLECLLRSSKEES